LGDTGSGQRAKRLGAGRVPGRASSTRIGWLSAWEGVFVKEDERQTASREALERVARESETIGSSALARSAKRVSEHFVGKDAIGAAEGGATDPVELWGRRTGRALSLFGVVVLAYWLGVQARWW
jgi:hypothetical protein